jgi:hypothetical protein
VAATVLLGLAVLSACAIPVLAGTKPSPSPDPRQQGLKFAACMRANGIPNFPDPSTAGQGQGFVINSSSGIDPHDPTFQKAQQTCSKYLGGTLGKNLTPDKAAQAKALKFSQCMRAHGVPNFPDPSSSGGLTIGPNSSLDPNDPTFQKAQQTCASILGLPAPTTVRGTGK